MNDFEARMTAINRHITTPQDLRERVNESLGAIRTEAAAALPQQPRRRARRLRLAAAGVAALAALAIGLGLAFAPTQTPTGPTAAFFFSAYATQQSGQQNTVTLQPSLHDAILTEDGCYSGTLFTVQGDGIEGVSVFLEGQGELYRQTPLPDGWTPETQEEGPALSWTVSEDRQRLSERLGQSFTVRYDAQTSYGFFGAYTADDGLTAADAARHTLLDLDGVRLGITVQYAPAPGEDQETRTAPVIESRFYRLESDGETLVAVFQQGRTWDENAEDDFDATAGGWAQEGDFSFVERNEAVGGGGEFGQYVASSFSIAGAGIERIEMEIQE